jgi:hypothetical protein
VTGISTRIRVLRRVTLGVRISIADRYCDRISSILTVTKVIEKDSRSDSRLGCPQEARPSPVNEATTDEENGRE